MKSNQWQILPAAPEEYQSASGVPALIAQLLYNRGIKLDEMDLFLTSDDKLAASPFLLPDIAPAVNRVYQALLSGEKIAVYGDFDVDGITATVVLVEGLSWLGAAAVPYLPDRHNEGHGLKLAAMEKLHDQGIDLIITVDCGVTDHQEVKKARKMGMDMIITDHHVPSKILPRAIAVIDPKRADSDYPFSHLAGVGVAFKFLQALLYKHPRAGSLNEMLDLVALGTVADMVPLVGENRYLAKEGIKVLNNTRRVGLQELISVAGLRPGDICSQHISWVLAPRINAASRVDSASTSYKLLVAQSSEEARSLARELEQKNIERQHLTDEVMQKVKGRLADRTHLPLLIEGDESYPLGIIGLAAGRLMEEFRKPAIVLSLGPETCRGSCRSIPEFNIAAALEKYRKLLITFGGHPLAAGFTLARQNLPELQEKIMKLAEKQLGHIDLHPALVIDTEVPLSTFDSDTLSMIQKLAPFGQANPVPTFLSRDVEVVEQRSLGNKGKHLELKIKQGSAVWRAVAFNLAKPQEEIPSHLDVVYNVEKTWWNKEEVLRLNLLDFAPSQLRQQAL